MKQKREKHGMWGHPAYWAWFNMKQRCKNPRRAGFHNYGGRGISVYLRWQNSFIAFWADMGATWAEGLELDRVDTNGNYEPGNCRWVTAQINSLTKRKQSGTSSRFRGVSWFRRDKNWKAQIEVNGCNRHIGYFRSEEEAARAYDTAAREYFGENARPNFLK